MRVTLDPAFLTALDERRATVHADVFRATELGDADADEREERAFDQLGRQRLLDLCAERTKERDEARAKLREACGLINDFDRVGVRASMFLDAANKAGRS